VGNPHLYCTSLAVNCVACSGFRRPVRAGALLARPLGRAPHPAGDRCGCRLGKTYNVPLICNEFGAYRRVTDPASRMNWIHDVRTALEADSIGWTMWDYRGGFGVVWKEDGQPTKVDDKVVEALGLKGR
jgi:hypothetical protein